MDIRSLALLALALSSPATAAAGWTITGSTVRGDGETPVPNVNVTLFPDSVAFVSDDMGDFVIPWDGSRGWLEIQAPGEQFCKRIGLYGKPPTEADTTLALGPLVSIPSGKAHGRGLAVPAAPLTPPDSVLASGPPPGGSDNQLLVFRVITDIYGQPTLVDQFNLEEKPSQELVRTVVEYLEKVRWRVNIESPCDMEGPFRSLIPLTYWWKDGRWLLLPNTLPKRRMEGLMRGLEREAEREALTGSRFAPTPDSTQAMPDGLRPIGR